MSLEIKRLQQCRTWLGSMCAVSILGWLCNVDQRFRHKRGPCGMYPMEFDLCIPSRVEFRAIRVIVTTVYPPGVASRPPAANQRHQVLFLSPSAIDR